MGKNTSSQFLLNLIAIYVPFTTPKVHKMHVGMKSIFYFPLSLLLERTLLKNSNENGRI